MSADALRWQLLEMPVSHRATIGAEWTAACVIVLEAIFAKSNGAQGRR